MLIVKIKEGESLDKALKDLKFKVKKTRLIQQLRERESYVKPSVKKRNKKNKAIYKEKLNSIDTD